MISEQELAEMKQKVERIRFAIDEAFGSINVAHEKKELTGDQLNSFGVSFMFMEGQCTRRVNQLFEMTKVADALAKETK